MCRRFSAPHRLLRALTTTPGSMTVAGHTVTGSLGCDPVFCF